MATKKKVTYEGDRDKEEEKEEWTEEKIEAKIAMWDRFKETEEDKIPPDDHDFWDKVYLATKLIFSGFLFICVLCSAVVSKGVLLILTWNVFTPVSENASSLKTLDSLFHYDITDLNPAAIGKDKVTSISYIWALFVMVVSPNVLTVVFCVWRIMFKKTGALHLKTLLLVLLPASLHSVGLNFIVFYILPSMDPISGLWYCCNVACAPSIVQLAFGRKKLRRTQNNEQTIAWSFIIRILAVVFSVLSLIFWVVYIALTSKSSNRNAQIVLSILSPILVSLSWVENFLPSDCKDREPRTIRINVAEAQGTHNENDERTNQQTTRTENYNDIETNAEVDKEKQITYKIYKQKNKIFLSNFKTYAIVNSLKVCLTFGMVIAIHGSPCDECARALLGLLQNPARQDNGGIISDAWLMDDEFCKSSTPFIVAIIGILTSIFCQRLSVAAIKVVAQIQGFSVPLCLVTPVTFLLILLISSQLSDASHICQFPFPWFEGNTSINNLALLIIASVTGYSALLLTAGHIWTKETDRMSKESKIFYTPSFCGILFEQSLMLNKCKEVKTLPVKTPNKDTRQNVRENTEAGSDRMVNINISPLGGSRDTTTDDVPMIYFCATMWHETETEMTQLLKSLFRMDIDQCVQSFQSGGIDNYNFEVHIFFDDAFVEGGIMANQYVHTFIRALHQTSEHTYPNEIPKLRNPRRRITPYGGRLKWSLPGGNKLIAHLKDKYKIRRKKRWSQVMYMYYFLSHKLSKDVKDEEKQMEKAKNIFILALDGDVDFRPEAVKLLIDRMKRNEQTGAACGRIHPIGDGPMVWYQKFEYAISHWLVKATEHVTGCVLCSPGCFSLFRGSALMEDNVMRRYTTMPSQARHYLQYDQGEDRWLCTLLLKQGKKIDYCAGSDAFTFAPEGFKEFYNQRRRWTPSTMANILDLLMDWRVVTNNNDNVSIPYICLQLSWFLSSILTPGTLLLMIIGATKLAYPSLSLHAALLINLLPIVVFVLVCFFAKTDHQLNVAAALSILYSLVMMIVLVGLVREVVEDGFCSVITWFLLIVSGIFVLSGLTHPKETKCLLHGFLFFIAIPSMSLLLMLYSVINLNNVSWGTREAPKTPTHGDGKEDKNKVRSVKGFIDRIINCSCCQPQMFYHNNKVDVQLERKKTELNKLESGTLHGDKVKSENDTTKGKTAQAKAEPEPYSIYLNFDPDSSKKVKYLTLNEEKFWVWLIKTYLFPSEKSDGDAEEEEKRLKEQNKVKEELKELRNKASLAFLLINALFITVIYFLQQSNENTGDSLSVQIGCGGGKQLVLEPISIAFTAVAGILLVIQFLCMLIHRTKTFLQLNSITDIRRGVDVKTLFNDVVRDLINKKPDKEEEEVDDKKEHEEEMSTTEEKGKEKIVLKEFIATKVMKQLQVIDAVVNMKDKEGPSSADAGTSNADAGTSSTGQTTSTEENKDSKRTVASVVKAMRNRPYTQRLYNDKSYKDLKQSLMLTLKEDGCNNDDSNSERILYTREGM